jgi:hypothetical protein
MRGDKPPLEGLSPHPVMAIAFKKPFTPDTPPLRNAADMTDKDHEEIPRGRCEAVYVLVYPRSSKSDLKFQYDRGALQGMGDCGDRPPWIKLNF